MSPLVTAAKPADITALRLQQFAPRSDYMHVAPTLDAAAKAHGILTPRQVRHWLANLHNESGGFTVAEERLGYTADELLATWPAHFASRGQAVACAGKPQAIACKVYGGRMGNTAPLDGWTYRGRGWLQLTGRQAYAEAGGRLHQPYEANPGLVAYPEHAALTAADFWAHHGCNAELATHADEREAANAVRRIVNGGLIGIDNVWAQLRRAETIWRD